MTSIKPTTPSANQSANISDAAEAKKTLSAQSKAGVDPFANDTFESNKPVRVTEDADVNLYAQEKDYGGFFKGLMKFLIKLVWPVGGGEDDIPRVMGKDIELAVKDMKPGDIILNGNNGGLSHAAMYVGDGDIVHAMATEKANLGVLGSLWNTISMPVKKLFGATEKIGVIKESAAEFFERYPRDTYVIMRDPQITPEQASQGVAKIESLVGKDYDYDFSAGDDDYYCTEIVMEYLEEAKGKENAPIFTTTHEKYPGLLDRQIVDPKNMLVSSALDPVIANDAAQRNFSDNLGAASIIPHLNREVEA